MNNISHYTIKDKNILVVKILVKKLGIDNINEVYYEIIDIWRKLKKHYHIIADCSLLNGIDSTTIGATLSRYIKMKKIGLHLCIANPTASVKRVLDLTLGDVLLKSFESIDDAVKWIEENGTE